MRDTHVLYIYMHIYISAFIHYSVARVSSRVVDDYSKVMRSGWRSHRACFSRLSPRPKTCRIVQSLFSHRENWCFYVPFKQVVRWIRIVYLTSESPAALPSFFPFSFRHRRRDPPCIVIRNFSRYRSSLECTVNSPHDRRVPDAVLALFIVEPEAAL